MSLLIKNGRIIDPAQSLDRVGAVMVENGTVKGFDFSGAVDETSYRTVLDATGCIVSPGFIDMHVHLRDPGQEQKEDIVTGTHAAVAGGFTSVLAMPNTTPTNDCAAVTQYMVEKAKKSGYCKVYPVGALSKGLKGQDLASLEEMFEAGCIAFSDDGRPCYDTALFCQAMNVVAKMDAVIIEHCEDVHLTQGRTTIHEGEVARSMNLRGITSLSESRDVARSIVLASETGVKLHLAHISCAESMDMIKTIKSKNNQVTCEVCPHHLTLTVEEVLSKGTQAKMYPPLRDRRDVEALQAALAEGVIDVVATDHAPHTEEEKSKPFAEAPNGAIGLQTALPVMLTIVEKGIMSVSDLIVRMSTRPAEILKLKAGRLQVGWDADITVFSSREKHDLGKMKQYSRSKNTPFGGFYGHGFVEHTIVKGQVVYSRETP